LNISRKDEVLHKAESRQYYKPHPKQWGMYTVLLVPRQPLNK